MRKKLSILLLTLICLVGLTACGNEKEPTRIQTEQEIAQIMNISDMVYNYVMIASAEEHAEDLAVLSMVTDDENLDQGEAFRKSFGFYLDARTLTKAAESYKASAVDIGDPQPITTADGSLQKEIDVSEDEAIVTIPLKGSIRNGSMEIIFDDNRHITSITTNVDLTLGESMKKAGVNTAIGMGTVFVMLIVISFIITAMGIIPKLQEMGKKKEPSAPAVVEKTIEDIITREETDTDDTELVAVIAAAIAAYEGESSTDGFVVRSIRRIR